MACRDRQGRGSEAPRHIVAGHQNNELDDDADELLRTENTAVDFFNAKIERYPNHLGRTVLWAGTRGLYDVHEHPEGNIAQIVLNAWL